MAESAPAPTVPAYHYNVKMTCGGCSGAITRVLSKNVQALPSIVLTDTANAFHVSLPAQQVLVWGPQLPPFDEITQKIQKTGKEIISKELIEEQGKIPALGA